MNRPSKEEIDAEHKYRQQYSRDDKPDKGAIFGLVAIFVIIFLAIVFG